MKRLIFTLSLISGGTCYAQGINFVDAISWEHVKEIAKKEHKYIFMDVYATWCGPCKKMDQEVYSNDTVADYLNKNFISCKIQIDSNKNDANTVVQQYEFFKQIKNKYKIISLPTYLFFDSVGNLFHRAIGYHPVSEFLSLCKSVEKETTKYNSLLTKFNKNELHGSELLNYALYLNGLNEDSLSLNVALQYKRETIDKQAPGKALTKETMLFFYSFGSILDGKDAVIQYILNHKADIDKQTEDGFSNAVISSIATKEIIRPNLKLARKNKSTPNWTRLEKNVRKEWGADLAESLLLNTKIQWYSDLNDWDNAIKYHFLRIKKFSKPFDEDEAWEINGFIYSKVVQFSNNPQVLEKASIYMKELTESFPSDYAIIDTYANVLYKQGKKEEALDLERKAVFLVEKAKDEISGKELRRNLQNMEKGLPTWNL